MLKNELLRELNNLVRDLNKIDKKPSDIIFGASKTFIRKLIYYFFNMIDLGTASFRNESFFTQLK